MTDVPTASDDYVLWSAATIILKRYGNNAPRHVAERIGTLARDGDALGVQAWQQIASRIDRILRPGATQ